MSHVNYLQYSEKIGFGDSFFSGTGFDMSCNCLQ